MAAAEPTKNISKPPLIKLTVVTKDLAAPIKNKVIPPIIIAAGNAEKPIGNKNGSKGTKPAATKAPKVT